MREKRVVKSALVSQWESNGWSTDSRGSQTTIEVRYVGICASTASSNESVERSHCEKDGQMMDEK